MSTFSLPRSDSSRFIKAGYRETDLSVAEGYDPDLILAQHLVLDCNKPTFWALDVLAAHGCL